MIERGGHFGGIEAGEAAEVLHRNQGTGGFASGLAGAAHEPFGRVVAAAGDSYYVFRIEADSEHEIGVIGGRWG